MSFEIPMNAGDSNRVENVPLVPAGMNLCTLYGVADLGTQTTKFGAKRQIKLSFEFPLEKRVFWEGDPEKPSVISTEETMSLAEKANLRKNYIEPMLGRKLGKEEGYDPTLFIGKNFVATVSHSPDGKWANISSIAPLDEKNMKLFDLTSPHYPLVNTPFKYHLNDGFEGPEFAALPKNVRLKVMGSAEGEQHQKAGGKFAEPATTNQSQPATPTTPGAMGVSPKKLKMKPDAQYTYEALKQNNWTDDQIVAAGHAIWEEATPPAAPIAPPPSTPTPPPAAPVAPAPTPEPQAEPKLVFKNPAAQPLQAWLDNNWTVEAIVAAGHAEWVK